MAVAFAQRQSVIGQQRKSFVPKALSMPYSSSMKDIVESSLIKVKEKKIFESTDNIIASLVKRKGTLKVLFGASMVSVLLSQHRHLAQFFSQVLLQPYKSVLVLHPLRTKVLTGASLAVIGDALAQMKDDKKSYDIRRAASFAAFDSCYRVFQNSAIPTIVGLGQGNIANALFSIIPFVGMYSSSMTFFAALERTFLYQFGLIPFFYYPVFFTFTGMIQGLSLKETFDRAKISFFPCWKRNLLFWIPTQMVMFGLVADNWQIPFACIMGILWSLILSATAGKATKSD
jgi:protein Mpv17